MFYLTCFLAGLALAASFETLHEQGLLRLRAGQYRSAMTLLGDALAAARNQNAPSQAIARLQTNYASALYQAAEYGLAAEHYQGALGAASLTAGDRAGIHNNLAVLYRQQARLKDAEAHARRAIEIADTATAWHTLAETLRSKGEPCQAAAALDEAARRDADSIVRANILQSRGNLLSDESRYTEAAEVFLRAEKLLLKEFGDAHPATLSATASRAQTLVSLDRDSEAEPILVFVHEAYIQALGPEHTRVAGAANNLAQLYRRHKRYLEADGLYRKALTIWEHRFGLAHPEYAKGLHNLASLFVEQGKLPGAEKLYQRALRIAEEALGKDHWQTRFHASGLAQIYRLSNRNTALDALRRTYR